MARFLHLTTEEGHPILLNVEHIVSIVSDKDSPLTRLYEAGPGETPFTVQESFETIASLLESAGT